jgi:uncharacterized membrane protein HdeD (DUF308 family)
MNNHFIVNTHREKQMSTADQQINPQIENLLGDLQHKWGWLLALGILFVVLGTIGLGMTFALTMASMLFFGFLMLFGGAFQFMHSFQCKGWKSIALHILVAGAYLFGGIVIITNPMLASMLITGILGTIFLVVGSMRVVMAVQLRSVKGWWLPLITGIATLIFGAMILTSWPMSGLWIIGLLIAIDLIIHGWGFVALALTVKNSEATPA